jgi:hypothetical protein
MSQFLYRRFGEQGWLQQDQAGDTAGTLGIAIRIEEANGWGYIEEPYGINDNLKVICEKLKVAAIATMSSDITSHLFSKIGSTDSEFALSPNHITVPVINDLYDLTREGSGVTRRDFCCFIRDEKTVLVWSNAVDDLILNCAEVESKLMSCVKRRTPIYYVQILTLADMGCPGCGNSTNPIFS